MVSTISLCALLRLGIDKQAHIPFPLRQRGARLLVSSVATPPPVRSIQSAMNVDECALQIRDG